MTMNTDELEAELHEMEAQVQTNRHYLIKLMAVPITCPTCHGSGEETLHAGERFNCQPCKGEGTMRLRNLVEAANPDMVRLVSDGSPVSMCLDSLIPSGPLSQVDESGISPATTTAASPSVPSKYTEIIGQMRGLVSATHHHTQVSLTSSLHKQLFSAIGDDMELLDALLDKFELVI